MPSRIIIIFTIIIYSLSTIRYLIDTQMNGSLAQWFYNNYTSSSYGQLIWPKFKQLIIFTGTFFTITTALLVWLVSYYYAKHKHNQVIQDITAALQSLINEDKMPIMSKDYIEIENQLLQIQSKTQRNIHIMEQQAQQKNDLITYLAHDIKTPLTSVIGYLSLMDEAADMPDEQRLKYVRITLEKSYRLEDLINEFFEITRYNLHKITLEKEPIDLYYMLIQLSDEFYPLLSSQNKQVIIDSPEDLTILGDSNKLARVFNNILKNAAYYSNENSTINVAVKTDNKYTTISFRNIGKTIPPEKLTTIFDKFYRLDESRSSNTGGAGLGLAIAKEIVTLHQGEILAESQDGETTFSIKLPNSPQT